MPDLNTNTVDLDKFNTTLSGINGGDISEYINIKYHVADIQFGNIYNGELKNLPPVLLTYQPTPAIAVQVLKVPSQLQSHENQAARWNRLRTNVKVWRAVVDQNIARVLGIAKLTIEKDPDDDDDEVDATETAFEQITVITPWFPNGKIMTYVSDNPNVPKIPLLLGIAQGLSRLHNNPRFPICHGSLTPDNILVDAQGNPRITNFGLAPMMEDGSLWRNASMRSGMGVRYTAPELLQSVKRAYSAAADVYSYAMACFEIVTGHRPFEEYSNDPAVWAAVVFEKKLPTRPSDGAAVSDRLWQEWTRCWTRDVSARASSREMVNAMANVIESSTRTQNLMLVSGSDDKTIRLWDTQTGLQNDTIEAPHCVNSLAISSSGDKIATAAGYEDKAQKRVVLLNGEDQTEMWSVSTGGGVVAFSPDGRTLASSSSDNSVVLWESGTGRKLRVFPKHAGRITSIAFSPKGDRILTGSRDKTVKIWKVSSAAQDRALPGGSSFVDSVSWSPDGEMIGATYRNSTIRIWNANTGAPLPVIQAPSMMVCIAFSPVSPLVATGSCEGAVHFWDAKTGRPKGQAVKEHSQGVTSITFNSDGSLLATGSDDKSVRLWKTNPVQVEHVLSRHTGKVKCVTFASMP